MLPTAGFEFGMKAEVDERVLRGDRGDVDRTTVSAITAIRSAARDELLAAEAQTTVAAGTGDDVDVDFVDEHRARGCYSTGMIEILRPC